MGYQLLIDNDALLKLARYGLLDMAVEMFGISFHDVLVLPTAKYSLLPARNRLRRCKEEESAQRLEDFLKKSTLLNIENANTDFLDKLNAIPSIDAGEALLLAIGSNDPEIRLVTGDKRALVALSSEPTISHIANSLAGRIITLEVIFQQLVEKNFTCTQLCVRSKPDVDKALSNVFGIAAPASMDSVREGLTSYINHLQVSTGISLWVQFD